MHFNERVVVSGGEFLAALAPLSLLASPCFPEQVGFHAFPSGFPFTAGTPFSVQLSDRNARRSNLPDRINGTVGCQIRHKPSPSPSPRVTSLRLFTLRLLDQYLRDRSRILQQSDPNGDIRLGGTIRYDGANDFTIGWPCSTLTRRDAGRNAASSVWTSSKMGNERKT